MKRLAIFLAIIGGCAFPAKAQTNVFCAANLPCSILAPTSLPTGATPAITPISLISIWITANTAPTTITNITGGFNGQTIEISCGTGDTYTGISSGTYFSLSASWTCGASSPSIMLTLIGTVWSEAARAGAGGGSGVPITTVAGLSSHTAQKIAIVTDGTSATDCTVGGGATTVTCQYSGTSWGAVGSNNGTVSGQAAQTIPLGTSATVIGNQSHLTDNGSVVANSENSSVAGNECIGGPRPYIDVTCPPYMARGDQGALSASVSFTNGNSTITLGSQPGFQIGNGLSIPGAAAGPSLLVTQITGCDGLTYPASAGHVCISTSMTVSPAPGVTSGNVAYDDDTIPLTNAINASCASIVGGIGSHPPVFLPPGDYWVSQPQGSSTTPVLPNCTGLNMSGPAYGSAVINAHYISSNPGPAPVLSVPNQATIRNITFEGYNEALIFSSVANINLSNVSAITNYATGLSNNDTVILQGVFELNWTGGYISSNQTTIPNLLIEDNNAGQPSYLLDFENQRWGPGTDIVSETGVCTSLPANYLFKNIVREGADTNLFNFQQTGSYGCVYEGIILDQIQDADNTQPLLALINFNQPNGSIQGLRARYTTGSSGQAPLLTVTSAISPVSNIDVGCGYALSCSVVDGSGNLYGGSRTEEPDGGLDHSNPAYSGGAGVNFPICQAYGQAAHPISDRWFVNGSPCSTLGIDGYWGMLFGDGTSNGFTAQFQSTSPETVSIGMAKLLPPTSFSGSATTGGSLAAATYYGVIWATANTNCTLSGATFSTWAYATGVAVSGSNDAVNFTWTDPVSTPSTPDGYCISIATAPLSPGGGLGNSGSAIYISGASTTSFLYTGQTQAVIGNVQPYPTFTQRMNFYQNDFSPSTSGGANLGLNEPWLTLYLSSGNVHYSGNTFSFPAGGSGGTICISGYGTSGCGTGSGVSSFTGDSALISNSGSTGAVAVTLANTGVGYGVWGNTGSSSGAPGYHALSSYPTAAFPTLNQSTTGNAATATNLATYPSPCSGGQFSEGYSSGAPPTNNCATPSGTLPSGYNGQSLTNNGSGATSYSATSPTIPIGNGGSCVSLASANYTIKADSATVATGMQDRSANVCVSTGGSFDVIIPDLSDTGATGMIGLITNQSSSIITVSRETSDVFEVFDPSTGTRTASQTTFMLLPNQQATFKPSATSAAYDITKNSVPTVLSEGAVSACADSSGSGTAQSCNTSPNVTPTTGTTIAYTTTTTNSGTGLTVNVNSLGAKSIAIPGSSGWTTTLTAGIIPANTPLILIYSGTNWNVQQTGTAASGGGGISPIYDTATSGQTGNLSAVTMVTPGANHDYLFNWTVELSVAGTSCTGSTTVTLNAIFHSLNGSGTTTEVLGTLTIANGGVGTVGFVAEGADNILAESGTAVQFSTSGYTLGAGCTSTNPTYIVYPTLVQLW